MITEFSLRGGSLGHDADCATVIGRSLYVPRGANKQAFGAVATFDAFTP